jgi:catechol 2,3-dioxygenase-like lactoylglutathione lyase family enzyme
MTVQMIPILPTISLPETLAFYRALGFEVTHEQMRPNVYAATRRGDIHLHFMGIAALTPEAGYSACLIVVPALDELHAALAAGLRQAYGKVPLAGFPRISRMRSGQGRFTVVDVAGNSLIFIRQATDNTEQDPFGPPTGTRMDKALRAAARLRDDKNDDEAAARLLDGALNRREPSEPFERARVLAARAEIASALGDDERARSARAEIEALPLSDEQRAEIARELDANP